MMLYLAVVTGQIVYSFGSPEQKNRIISQKSYKMWFFQNKNEVVPEIIMMIISILVTTLSCSVEPKILKF